MLILEAHSSVELKLYEGRAAPLNDVENGEVRAGNKRDQEGWERSPHLSATNPDCTKGMRVSRQRTLQLGLQPIN